MPDDEPATLRELARDLRAMEERQNLRLDALKKDVQDVVDDLKSITGAFKQVVIAVIISIVGTLFGLLVTLATRAGGGN